MIFTENQKRIIDLSERAYEKGVYAFSDFLNPTEVAEIKEIKLPTERTFFGGAEFSERVVVRLGSKEEFMYEEDFPVDLIKITPISVKFCKPVTHRDFLGAILNLGVDRGKVGDIFTDSVVGYVAVINTLTDFLTENLVKVGANAVKTTKTQSVPDEFKPKTQELTVIVPSLRADAVIAKVYNLSRDASVELFFKEKVAVNGKTSTENARPLRCEEVVSVRGFGKFIFKGQTSATKKDKLCVKIEKYV